MARTGRNATSVTRRASRSPTPWVSPAQSGFLASAEASPTGAGARPRRRGAWYHRPRLGSPCKEPGTLSASDPNYDAATDTYRQIYRGHDNASAVTNAEGLTVYFDPDTNDVLGFSIANFSAYYEAHKTDSGEFEVNLPAKVPVNLEEEMDFDAEAIRSGVRIAEFY